jgi:hypothetical protein
MTDPAPADGGQGEFLMSQCYYGSKEPNMSVSIAVVERTIDFSGNRTVTEFWHERLNTQIAKTEKADHGGAEKEHANEREEKGRAKASGEREERENAGPPPRKVDGLGEEAYWMGSPAGGLLYVLQNDYLLRISVGGPGDEQSKLEKSEALAQKALSRLP